MQEINNAPPLDGALDDSKPENSLSLTLIDIYYVLFRHKWKILGLSLLGFAAAACAYLLWPKTIYSSGAKLFIRYIEEAGTPSAVTDDAQIKSTDQRGETIINSEIEILTSMDLAKDVAVALGPERVLEAFGGGADVDAAAGVIRGGLTAQAAHGSRVVELMFTHPDRSIVQPVLAALIAEYRKKHVEVHMSSGMFDDILSKETQLLREHLTKTEEELRQLQERAGVVSLEETKRANAEQMSKLQQQIWDATIELAQRKAVLADFERSQIPDKAVPAAKAQDYRTVLAVLDTQTRKYQELLTTFSAESTIMTSLRQRITDNTTAKERLEAEYPPLQSLSTPTQDAAGKTTAPLLNVPEEQTRIRFLSTRLKVLQDDLDRMHKAASELGTVEMSITDLQRRKELEESQYKYFSSSMEKSRINEELGSGRVSNITTIESPTPPVRDVGKLYKVVAGLAGSGIACGLALAFSLELFFDQTVRRPGEVESLLGLPLFFSIPNIRGGLKNGRPSAGLLAAENSAGGNGGRGWPVPHKLASHFDALRDRLIFYFEIRGLTKKPKLIAVTGCGNKSGISTVAAGLAASLSKSGEGNVLLVDMNMEQHAPSHFRNGKLAFGLDQLLDGGKRDEAMVQDNLYVVPHAIGNERLARILPKRFTDMIPRLRASEYEYIIFDMPAVSQLSVTPQLSRFMDMVFLLAESEKTNRGAVKRAGNLLTQANCTLGVIVNRTRNYLPRALLQEV